MTPIETKFNEKLTEYGLCNEDGFIEVLLFDTEDNSVHHAICSVGYAGYDTGDERPLTLTEWEDEQVFYCFADWDEVRETLAHLQFLPEDYEDEDKYISLVKAHNNDTDDLSTPTFFAILDVQDILDSLD